MKNKQLLIIALISTAKISSFVMVIIFLILTFFVRSIYPFTFCLLLIWFVCYHLVTIDEVEKRFK